MKFVEMALHQRRTSVHFSIIQPTGRPPAMVGPWYGAVGRSVSGIKFPSYSGAQIPSLGGLAFQAVGSAKCVISVSITRWRARQHPRSTAAAYL